MNNLTILVATEDEKRALIPTEYYDNVFITGIGIINIIKTLKDTKFDGTIINIGYAGATSNIKVGEVCFVNNSYCYRNIYNDCYSIKIVSDNGCMEDYDNALSYDYKHIIKEIIDKLYKI